VAEQDVGVCACVRGGDSGRHSARHAEVVCGALWEGEGGRKGKDGAVGVLRIHLRGTTGCLSNALHDRVRCSHP
jgi:hypothetical protein